MASDASVAPGSGHGRPKLPSQEQFEGCLVGQCLGDALGFVVEGYPPEVCRHYADDALMKGLAGRHGRGPFAFGQYSDDSQLARELLRSYAACGRFCPEDYAGRIAAIFSEGRIVGRGRATEQAARRLAEGVPWREAGTPPPSAGNGSAMRAGPIGLIFYDDHRELVRAAHEQGLITHRDTRCSAGAVTIAGAVALALRRDAVEPAPFLEWLAGLTEPIEPQVAAYVRRLTGWLSLPPDGAVAYISRAGLDHAEEWRGISPFVTGSVLWSLYSFLRSPEDFRETIRTAIAVGGDVDTTAAMAGAISGAHLGIGAVPSELAHQLTDQGAWGLSELVDLADRCYKIKRRQRT